MMGAIVVTIISNRNNKSSRRMERLKMGSKYIDITIAVFMGYFAYTRFMNGQMGFAILFLVLFMLNVMTAVIKHNNAKNSND